MDHDHAKENWSRVTNRYCDCPPFRYNPLYIHKRETNPDCPQHGTRTTDPLGSIFLPKEGP